MSKRSTLSRGLAIAAVCVLSIVVGVGLAWWQWERYSSAGGTFQNLGYVLQWPLFGLFPLFMVWRMRRLRQQANRRDRSEPQQQRQSAPTVNVTTRQAVPDEPEDDELAAYNRYLAELNAREREGN